MEALAAAAAAEPAIAAPDTVPAAPEAAAQPDAAAGTKRGRGSALESAEKKVTEKLQKIIESEAKLLKLQALPQLKQREKEQLAKEDKKLAGLRHDLVWLERALK